MTEPTVSTTELLTRIQQGWDSLYAFINGLTNEQITVNTDAAGWTVKDHLMHLAVWEDGFVAVLNGENRRERMGVTPEVWHPETWHTEGFDDLNAAIQQQHKDKSMDAVRQAHVDIHARLIARIRTMSDADLLRPYREFDTTSTSETAILYGIIGDSYGHYGDHIPWMDAIAHGENHKILSKKELLSRVEQGWDRLNAYVERLSDEQFTQPTNPAGWTAKDHFAHLAIWEDSVNALFDYKMCWQHMGVEREAWERADWDAINAVIQQRYKNTSRADLQEMFNATHERLLAKLNTLYDSDLQLPYKHYQPDSALERPALHWVVIDTYEHYDEHMDYIARITGLER